MSDFGVATDLEHLGREAFCYLTTRGRTSGRPRTSEIWFVIQTATVYMLAGGGARSQWVPNLLQEPEVQIRIDEADFPGRARVLERGAEKAAAAGRLLLEKYQPTYGGDLTGWSLTPLPVAVDLQVRGT